MRQAYSHERDVTIDQKPPVGTNFPGTEFLGGLNIAPISNGEFPGQL